MAATFAIDFSYTRDYIRLHVVHGVPPAHNVSDGDADLVHFGTRRTNCSCGVFAIKMTPCAVLTKFL